MRRFRLGLLCSLLSATGAMGQVPRVYLNHVVTVVDSATYRAIGTSEFLKERFAGMQQRTMSAAGGVTWTGTYLFGNHTYLEMFAPGGVAGPAGNAMVGYGVENAGELWQLRPRLAQATGSTIDSLLRVGTRGKEQIPWFYAISVRGVMAESRLASWVMEYYPGHERLIDSGPPPAHSDLRRHAMLAKLHRSDRYLDDVIGMTLAAESKDRDRLIKEAAAFGYKVAGTADRPVLVGPDLTINLVPAVSDRRGLLELRFRLVNPPARHEEARFGARSVLRVEPDGTATWTF